MALDGVVTCAAGIRIAQRGVEPGATGSTFRIGPVRPVQPPATEALDSQRADGVTWRHHWTEAGRMVIEFVDVAVVEVTYDDGLITFDRDLLPEPEQHLVFDHVLPLLLAHRGHLVLHGGLISRAGSGVVLVGSSGAGKSTLAAHAWQNGWVLGGDDGAVIATTRPPTVQPTYATLRLDRDSVGLLGLEHAPSSAIVGKRRFDGHGQESFRLDPIGLEVVALIEPAPHDDRARFVPLRGIDAHAELFGSTFHAELAGGRLLPAVVEGLAAVVETTRIGRLTVPRGVAGLAAAEELLRAELEGRRR